MFDLKWRSDFIIFFRFVICSIRDFLFLARDGRVDPGVLPLAEGEIGARLALHLHHRAQSVIPGGVGDALARLHQLLQNGEGAGQADGVAHLLGLGDRKSVV